VKGPEPEPESEPAMAGWEGNKWGRDDWLGFFASTLHDGHWIWEIGPSYDAAGELGRLLV
jgi:hypothetical protein